MLLTLFYCSNGSLECNVLFLSLQNVPPDLAQCVFVIEQALSVRALQELITSGADDAVRFY